MSFRPPFLSFRLFLVSFRPKGEILFFSVISTALSVISTEGRNLVPFVISNVREKSWKNRALDLFIFRGS
jgi:hypothetical protein